MVNEPKPGDTSYEKHVEEKGTTLASLIRRAHIMTDGFNKLEGVTCNFTEGAMYSFPRIRLPPKVQNLSLKASGTSKHPTVGLLLFLCAPFGGTIPF